MPRHWLHIWVIASVAVLLDAIEIDLTVDVAAGVRECFYQKFDEQVDVNLEYQVIEGGDLDVNFVAQSPTGRVLISEMRKMEGIHHLKAPESGDYAFCFDNTFSRFSNKMVFFEVLTDEEDEQEFKGVPDDTVYDIKLEDFKKSLDEMLDKLKRTTQIQNVMRAIESRDRSMQEHNFERVNLWSGIQIFVMLSVSLTNVLIIRGLFSDNSKARPTKMRT